MNGLLWVLPGLPAVSGALLLIAHLVPSRRHDGGAEPYGEPARGRSGWASGKGGAHGEPAAGRRPGGLLRGAREGLAGPVAVLVAVVTLLVAVLVAVDRPRADTVLFDGLRSGLAVDGLSAVMVVTVAAVALAVLAFAAGEARDARFFGLMLLFTAAMLVTVTAADLALLLMAWEVMGAMSYALIGYRWHDAEHARSADLAFVTTRAGDLGLYLAAGCALAGTGSLSLAALPAAGSPWAHLIAAGIVVAALGKSAQLPFSFWLSRAMAGPSAVSALLHSATMVAAGAYLLLRVEPLLAATGWAATLVAWAGALTALLLGAVALAQRDLKQLLAASTCAQVGFMVLAAGVAAVAGGVAHLVAHAAVKSLLFLCAGVWLTTLGTEDLVRLRGAARRHPVTGVTFGIGAAALAGLPPLSLWVTKDAVLASVHPPALRVVAFAATLLAAAYATKALIVVWRPGAPAPPQPGKRPGEGPLGWAPLAALALAAAGFGVVGVPVVFDGWAGLLGVPAERGPGAAELAVSGGLAVVVAGLVLAVRRRGVRPLGVDLWWGPARWFGLERVARTAVARPVMALAGALARFDDRVIDGAVHGAARAVTRAAGIARTPVETGIDGVVRAVAAGAGRLGTLARRPQTGQAHLYLAQAAIGLALLAVVIALVR
ncbi:proton-conducting transporter transmembrane domain-containing protein [Streptosporangium soli]|nr:NADH-quinone oxidoreductase subunit L [Streptosporangium sp. KLBMP 9127]